MTMLDLCFPMLKGVEEEGEGVFSSAQTRHDGHDTTREAYYMLDLTC
jgi:hypothetical protein